MIDAHEAHARLTLRVGSSEGRMSVAAAYAALRALGFVRSDFGMLAWYSNLSFGNDRLLVADLGAHAETLSAEDTTRHVSVDLRLDVPHPELVARAAWHTAESLAAATGAEIALLIHGVAIDPRPATRVAFDERVSDSLAALRAVGFHSDWEPVP